MWKKTLVLGTILGIVSFGLFFCSRLIINYDVDIYGVSIKIIKKIEIISALGMAIAIAAIAISAFARFCLKSK